MLFFHRSLAASNGVILDSITMTLPTGFFILSSTSPALKCVATSRSVSLLLMFACIFFCWNKPLVLFLLTRIYFVFRISFLLSDL